MQSMQQALMAIRHKTDHSPKVGLILGSGLGGYAQQIEQPVIIPYPEIPGFGHSTVQGHAGQLVLGWVSGTPVALMSGRLHFYEGHQPAQTVFPIRVLRALGVETLIVTNAAGGVNTAFVPGDLMIISDHINFAGVNPLIGPNDEQLGPRFPDMSRAYAPELRALARHCAQTVGVNPQEGVYAMMSGPSFETPAEIRMLRVLGADAVGMSTVPEVIAANHSGMRVLGISCISNMAAGILDQPLNHQEVIDTGARVADLFTRWIGEILRKIQ